MANHLTFRRAGLAQVRKTIKEAKIKQKEQNERRQNKNSLKTQTKTKMAPKTAE